jgi:hypothetical protein
MPIRAFLDAYRFDDDTARLMGIAFEMAVGSLCATPHYTDPVREAVARRIRACESQRARSGAPV